MPKPPSRPPAPRARKTDTVVDRVAGRAIVAKPMDPRQPGLFDAPLPGWMKPCLPTLVEKPPIGNRWVHEIKWDGYRVSAYVQDGDVTIRTRNGHDWTKRFPAIAAGVAALKVHSAVIDGEAVVLDERGRSDFAELRSDLTKHGSPRAVLYAFDLLFFDGNQPTSGAVRGALANIKVARFDGGRLRYAGAVGTGFSEAVASVLRKRLDAIVTEKCAVVGLKGKGAVWVAPELKAEIAYRGFAPDVPFGLVEEAPDLSSAADLKTLIADIDSQSKALGFRPVLIVLDTLARSIANLNESDSQGMNTFIGNAKALHKHFDALVMPVHHTGKDVERGMRGSSALQGAADAIWCLKRENDETRFEVEKMKDGADGVAKAFTLVKYGLGSDDDGDEMSTLVVDRFGEPAPVGKKSAVKVRAPGTADEDLPLVIEIFAAEGKTGKARAKGLDDEVPAIMRQKLVKSLATRLRADHPALKARCEDVRANRCLQTLEARNVLRTHGKWSSLAAVASVTEAET